MPKVQPDQMPHWNKPPMQISKLPHSNKSPFEKWSEPTPDQILASLNENTVVIFADGSCKPEPGLVGAGLFIQDPLLSQGLELEFPITGITTMIGSEIEAVQQGIEYVAQNYRASSYNFPVAECQILMKELGENDVPEIYWIKCHSKIPGN